jgi:hypothetical protein
MPLIGAFMISRLIYVAAELGIADLTARGLEHTIRTGETKMKRAFGTTGFEYRASHPVAATIFNAAMAEVTHQVARAAIAAYDFLAFRVIMDVGGGNSTLLAEILRSVPSAVGILFDVPAGLTEARESLLRGDVADRCSVVPDDFFKSVPRGTDLMVLKNVIHGRNDERATAILSQRRAAASEQSRLLLVERAMPERMTVTASTTNQRAVTLDIRILAVVSGIERTEDQYGKMLASAGFGATRTIVLPEPLNQAMIEAAPI